MASVVPWTLSLWFRGTRRKYDPDQQIPSPSRVHSWRGLWTFLNRITGSKILDGGARCDFKIGGTAMFKLTVWMSEVWVIFTIHINGQVPKWLKGAVLKTVGASKTSVGSNPTLSSSAKGIALTQRRCFKLKIPYNCSEVTKRNERNLNGNWVYCKIW